MRSFLAIGCTLAQLALGFAIRADAQAISFELDEHGRLITVADAFGQITRYARDSAGRLLRLTYPDGRWNEYRYDDQGRLSELRTEQGRELRYRYDPQGRWSEVRFPNGDTLRYAAAPDEQGLNLTYPDGSVAAFRFDTKGRIERAETPLSSLAFRYDTADRLDTLLWAGGRATSFRYDGENRLRGIVDAAGTERHDWEMTVRTAETGRILNVTDALDQVEIRRDDAGRLTSAASAWGWKAFFHWQPGIGQPRSMTSPWGYVEFDSRGQPREILTAQGGRTTARWDGAGRLERMIIPPLGDLRLTYGADRFPSAIELGDGLRTPLQSAERSTANAYREPLARKVIERENGIQLRFPMPALSAEKLFDAQGDRFWSRVASLVEASSKLPPPGTERVLASDDYWISGKYQSDPYYKGLAQPAPELSAENYLKMFSLTMGITAVDFGRFYLDVVPGIRPWIGFLCGRGALGLRRGMRELIASAPPGQNPLDPGYVGSQLDNAGATLRGIVEPISWFHDLREQATNLLEHGQILYWMEYGRVKTQTELNILMMTEDRLVHVNSRRVVELRFLTMTKAVAFDWLGAITDERISAAREDAKEALDEWLLGNFKGKSKAPEIWKAFSLRLEAVTRQVLSAIDLFTQTPTRVPGSPSEDPRSGVKILRQALAADLAAIPVNRELKERGKAMVEKCPPDQVVCQGVPP